MNEPARNDERETVMTFQIARLLPRWGDADDRQPGVPFWFLVAVAAISTARSLIHLLTPDGGAHSIAGIVLESGSGGDVVAVFAQWGASQLVLAVVYWVVIHADAADARDHLHRTAVAAAGGDLEAARRRGAAARRVLHLRSPAGRRGDAGLESPRAAVRGTGVFGDGRAARGLRKAQESDVFYALILRGLEKQISEEGC
jgi:hypothetical protein